MKNLEKTYKIFEGSGNAELTNSLIPGDNDFEYPEWQEFGQIKGIPVIVYYRTNPDDQETVNENGGDWGAVDWGSRIDRITLDLNDCEDIPDHKLADFCKQHKIDWE